MTVALGTVSQYCRAKVQTELVLPVYLSLDNMGVAIAAFVAFSESFAGPFKAIRAKPSVTTATDATQSYIRGGGGSSSPQAPKRLDNGFNRPALGVFTPSFLAQRPILPCSPSLWTPS